MTVIPQKITQKEWRQYIEQQLYLHGFTKRERDVIRAAFDSDLHDAEYGEIASFFEHVKLGITEEELRSTIAALRDKNSALSKGSKLQLSSEKLDNLEGILRAALIENKERLF